MAGKSGNNLVRVTRAASYLLGSNGLILCGVQAVLRCSRFYCFRTVPFYKETKRKELVSTGEPVKMANLLEEIGISIEQANKYVYKKCARKIANCHQLYVEIASSLSLTRDIEAYPSLQELDEKKGPPLTNRFDSKKKAAEINSC